MNKFEIQVQNEAIYLGCILTDPSLIDESVVNPKHFVNLQNRELFKAMLNTKKEGEEPSVYALSQLGDTTVMKFGGTSYLYEVMNTVPSVHAFKTYENNIMNFHTVQQAQEVANRFIESTKEIHNIKELETLIHRINKLEGSTVKPKENLKQIVSRRMEQHMDSPKDGLSGISTGFINLNRFTDGWQNSDLIIIAARPSMGKTALLLNSMLNACKEDNVYSTFFSIEMAKELIVDRLIAIEGQINLMKMRNPNKTFTDDDWTKYHKAVGRIESLDIDVRDENTVPAIRSALRKNIREHPDKRHIASIDFLTLLKAMEPTGNSHADITGIIQDLKLVTKELNIPIIVLAQLNRGVEGRQEKRPTMSDIRESGSVEQIADLIALLYRDDYYNQTKESESTTELIIAKSRNGQTGTVKLRFIKETNIFRDLLL